MMKAVRETRRIAEACGIDDVKIMPGDPHARIIGTVNGKPLIYVTSLSTAHVTRPRFQKTLRAQLRRAVAELR